MSLAQLNKIFNRNLPLAIEFYIQHRICCKPLSINGTLIEAARVLLRWTQAHLHKKAKVGLGTVIRIEAGKPYRAATMRKLIAVLTKAGIEFLNHDEPGVRDIRNRKKKSGEETKE